MDETSDPDALSFSVIVPTYQGVDTVCDTVRSICALRWNGAVEVIVVVDGSTDGTAAALKPLDCRFPIRIVEQTNRGLAAARNRGAAEASGSILLFLDDDMICSLDLLEQHANSFRQGADAVVGNFVEEGGVIAGLTSSRDTRSFQQSDGPVTALDMYGGHLAVRRDAFEQVGGYDPSFTEEGRYGCEDFDFAQRLLKDHIVVCNSRAVCRHHKSISPTEYVRRARQSARSEARLLEKHPELRSDMIRWTGAAHRSKRLRLLSRIPLVPQIAAECVAIAVAAAARTPMRASRSLERLCHAAYAWNYWSSVYREGALPELWGRNAVC
jgi:glycosyltransferase involved in cell wall biosynthesis